MPTVELNTNELSQTRPTPGSKASRMTERSATAMANLPPDHDEYFGVIPKIRAAFKFKRLDESGYNEAEKGKENGQTLEDSGSGNMMDTLDDLPPGIGQYDDFHTIDWLREIARDRMRHRHIVKKRLGGCWERLKGAHDAWSGWVCVLLVGVAAGTCAGIIDIGATWMSDLKEGMCLEAFWFSQEQCCWSGPSLNSTSMDEDEDCVQAGNFSIPHRPAIH